MHANWKASARGLESTCITDFVQLGLVGAFYRAMEVELVERLPLWLLAMGGLFIAVVLAGLFGKLMGRVGGECRACGLAAPLSDMPVCKNCDHGGRDHNWVSPPCWNCGGRSLHCHFCFEKYLQRRKRGQCRYPGANAGSMCPGRSAAAGQ